METGFSASDRRASPRRPLHTRASIRIDGKIITVKVQDVSTGGMGILVNSNPSIGATLEIEFNIPDKSSGFIKIRSQARVMNSFYSLQVNGFRVGLSFVDLPPSSSEALKQFLNT